MFSACIVAQNEAFCLEVSVRSILPFVEEVVIVENGSYDRTKEIIRKLVAEYPSQVIGKFVDADIDLATVRNIAQDAASGDWIIWWDADFVAYNEGQGDHRCFSHLLDDIRGYDGSVNQVLHSGPSVGPSFDCVVKGKEIHGFTGDTQITRKGFMSFTVAEYIDSRRYATDRVCAYLHRQPRWHFLHVDVKHRERLAIRSFVYEYQKDRAAAGDPARFVSLAEWYRKSVESKCIPYDFERWGAHPEILNELQGIAPFVSEKNIDGSVKLADNPQYMPDENLKKFLMI